MDYLNMMIKEI